jgi:uncharacterized protein YjbJ (UPF0337 family)
MTLLTKARGIKDELAATTKRLVGEILGDQQLYDDGKAQEHEGRREHGESKSFKPLGNLDRLT